MSYPRDAIALSGGQMTVSLGLAASAVSCLGWALGLARVSSCAYVGDALRLVLLTESSPRPACKCHVRSRWYCTYETTTL